jgi:large subunit ribosomal protein L6e
MASKKTSPKANSGKKSTPKAADAKPPAGAKPAEKPMAAEKPVPASKTVSEVKPAPVVNAVEVSTSQPAKTPAVAAKSEVKSNPTVASDKPVKVEKAAKPLVVNKEYWYNADGKKIVRKRSKTRKATFKTPKLRASIVPGSILIVLNGRYRGKRVVFLKQLFTGLLLVTGPFRINGVPLCRLGQSFVIATSTKVDVSKCEVSHIDDAYFAKEKKKRAKKITEDEFYKEKPKKSAFAAKRQVDQKKIDCVIQEHLKKDTLMAQYLGSRFTLSRKDNPHEMVF